MLKLNQQLERAADDAADAVDAAKAKLDKLLTDLKLAQTAHSTAKRALSRLEKKAKEEGRQPTQQELRPLIEKRAKTRDALAKLEGPVQQQQQTVNKLKFELREANDAWKQRPPTNTTGTRLPPGFKRVELAPRMETFAAAVDIPEGWSRPVHVVGGDPGAHVPCTFSRPMDDGDMADRVSAFNYYFGLDKSITAPPPPPIKMGPDGKWVVNLKRHYAEYRTGTVKSKTGEAAAAADRERQLREGQAYVFLLSVTVFAFKFGAFI